MSCRHDSTLQFPSHLPWSQFASLTFSASRGCQAISPRVAGSDHSSSSRSSISSSRSGSSTSSIIIISGSSISGDGGNGTSNSW